jgi:hypothetical protein
MASSDKIFIINKARNCLNTKYSFENVEHQKKKAFVLINTLASLLKNKLYSSILNIIDDLHSTVSPFLSNTLFLIDLVVLFLTKSNNSEYSNKFIIRNKDKILNDENCKRLNKIVYVLSYFTSTTESEYFKALLDNVSSSIVKFVGDMLPSYSKSKDIDLCLFFPLFDEVVYLQACYQKVQIKCQSFDIFVTSYQHLMYYENEKIKSQIIECLFMMFNADYEVNQLLRYNQMEDDATTFTEKNNYSNLETQENESTIDETLSRNCFYNSNSYLEMIEKYSFNESDKLQVVDFIIECFQKFYEAEKVNWICQSGNYKLPSSCLQTVRQHFNNDYLKRKDYYIDLFMNHMYYDNKFDIKVFFFKYQYQNILAEVQKLLIIN